MAGGLTAALWDPEQGSSEAVLRLLIHGKWKRISLWCFNPLSLWWFVHSHRRLISYLEFISTVAVLAVPSSVPNCCHLQRYLTAGIMTLQEWQEMLFSSTAPLDWKGSLWHLLLMGWWWSQGGLVISLHGFRKAHKYHQSWGFPGSLDSLCESPFRQGLPVWYYKSLAYQDFSALETKLRQMIE